MTTIINSVIAPFRASKGQLRPSMLPKYREALNAFLTDLFAAARHGRWSRLETNTDALHGYPGGATAFKTMREAVRAAGLVEEMKGFIRPFERWGLPETECIRTSFRPTAQLLGLAADYGVRLEDFTAHFEASKAKAPVPANVLEARAAKLTKKDRPKRLLVNPQDAKASAILANLECLNGFLMAEGRIDGVVFAGLRRIFSNADHPDFAWQWHGRFYSMPNADTYENMEGGQQARSKAIRIDGEAVVEVDICASHLTILHGLLGLPFDPSQDPYALNGLPREEVKTWINLAFGSGNSSTGGNKFNKARQAGLARYPFLADLQTLGISPLDLQFHEAEVLRLAMEDLMAQGVGFLPVHDALMVPYSQQDRAADAIRSGMQNYFTRNLGKVSSPRARISGGRDSRGDHTPS
ncbi:hypothetical protein [Sphingobium sp. B12D2B]|uniref:hypothetical protein n=1 Tax=Sphingobium sp. B12D2B TaxID=2940577 RepID=UPI0022254833|nr:hypothetical protein [Sphingobium sp. B12D2B]MCW2349806.1 hypothetical protein [Sphingobium sp. B12D2B]